MNKNNNMGTVVAIIGIGVSLLLVELVESEIIASLCSLVFVISLGVIICKGLFTNKKKTRYVEKMPEEELLYILNKYVYNDKGN